MVLVLTFFSSHLYAWLHWNPTQDKEKRLPHAPHNNTVTHPSFMKLISTLVVLQPSCTYKTLPVSLYFIWFRASRIIKHLQHNQHPPRSKWRRGAVLREPPDPHQASLLGICFCYRADHTACYHDNKQKFPFIHFTQVLFSTDTILPSPPCQPPRQPPRSCYPPLCFEHPRELGEYTSIDFPADKRSEASHMTNSDVSEITASFPYEQYHFVNELLFSWPCQSCEALSGDPAVWASSYRASPSEEACRETLSGLQRRDERGGKGHEVTCLVSPTAAGKHFSSGLQTEIDSPPPYLGDS